MLKFFSRLEKTRNFVLLAIAVVMVLSMVFFGASQLSFRDSDANLSKSSETVAKVGRERITVGELVTKKQSLAQMYGGRSIPAKFIIDGAVRDRMVRVEAARLGLTPSDEEVAREILQQFKSPDGKAFDRKNYEQLVTEQYGSVTAYEQTVRDQIAGEKMQAYITAGVSLSEAEVLDNFKRRNTKFDLSFVPVSVADVAKNLKPSDDELKAYFEQNKKNYYVGLPQKKIRYVFVNTAKIGEKIVFTDAELQAEYDKLAEDKKQAGVNGQQIVLRIPKPDQESEVLAKGNEIVTQARKNGTISEEDFANLAKGRSEDPVSAQNGGRLKGLVRSNPNNPTDPYQKLLTLKEGEVTEPVKLGASFYILRRGASVPKSFADAKKEIEVSLRNRRGYTVAADLAQKISDRLKEVKDVQKVAEEFASQAYSNAKDMVRETPFVKPGDDVPNIGISPQFEDGIMALETVNDVGDKTPIKDGFAIPMLAERREPRDATFDEVKTRLTDDYKLVQAKDKVEQVAKEIASGAANAAGLAAAATAKGFTAEDSKSFILGSPLGKSESAATSASLEDAIYDLKSGEVTKTPIKVGDNWYIVGVTNRTEANNDDFAKQRDELVQQMLGEARGKVMSDYLTSVRARMDAAGEIKIYKEVLDKIDAADKSEDIPDGR